MPANLVLHERYPFAFYCFHNDRSRHSFHSLCLVKSSAQLRHVIADKDVKVSPGVHLEGTEKYPLVLGKGAEV